MASIEARVRCMFLFCSDVTYIGWKLQQFSFSIQAAFRKSANKSRDKNLSEENNQILFIPT